MRQIPYYHPAYQGSPEYRNFPYSYGSAEPVHMPFSPEVYQDPFTQYAKPKLPDDWYQQVQTSQSYGHPSAFNQPEGIHQMGESGAGEHLQSNQANIVNPQQNHLSSESNSTIQNQPGFEQPNFDPYYSSMPFNEMPPQSAPKQPNSLLSQYQNTDGQLDVDKMLGTVGQLANTYHQVAPIVKQVSSLIKSFR